MGGETHSSEVGVVEKQLWWRLGRTWKSRSSGSLNVKLAGKALISVTHLHCEMTSPSKVAVKTGSPGKSPPTQHSHGFIFDPDKHFIRVPQFLVLPRLWDTASHFLQPCHSLHSQSDVRAFSHNKEPDSTLGRRLTQLVTSCEPDGHNHASQGLPVSFLAPSQSASPVENPKCPPQLMCSLVSLWLLLC